ncbi:fat-like cadherin-related tumor suppressor homolog [Condylostylus longicornis]|uniref:fat-like cadherin-related tumor suppressor homolog n=1 Tax=Condylostylus longicornis TaxID=2530218 RepID=UPI00244E2D6B|nr:fat-like cadherin-related tumor suppressor homolog [Condylostylus longicornis]
MNVISIKMAKIFLLKGFITIILLGHIKSQEWEKDYFECIERNDNKINCTAKEKSFEIDLEEEIPWPFYLVKLKYNGGEPDTGKHIPSIKRFMTGDNNLLGAEFEKKQDGWYIKINERQDYENPPQILYTLEIYIKGEEGQETPSQWLTIKLKNIFDNDPVVKYADSVPCTWEAYQSDVDTNCKILVHDKDGLANNEITMFVEDTGKNERDHFGFSKIPQSTTEYTVEYFIRINKKLDYDENAWFNLHIIAEDVEKNRGDTNMTFYVKNVPHSPPRWVKPLVIASFKEKEKQEFNVTAIGGDIGIEDAICYKLRFSENNNYSELIEINELNGALKVKEIDRDARQQEIYKFEICAEKCDDSFMNTCNLTVFIVDDINDHSPVIKIEPIKIALYENYTQEISLNKFDVSDVDLGENAMYDVKLSSAEKAFSIVPSSGYQNASFQLIIKDKDFLDYENPHWRFIEIKVFAQEKHNLSHTGEFSLNIDLINWNDEPPTFEEPNYSVELEETIPKGYLIKNITAFDRDVDDFVRYKTLGNFYGVQINEENGTMYTTEDNVFDYDRQKAVIIQVQATDNLITGFHAEKLNSVFTQLIINVKDVNNKTPELRMPRIVPNCTENTTDISAITTEIKAIDPDTDANLVFEIDWDHTFATKTGRPADLETYKECFVIEQHNETNNEVLGYLKLNPEQTTIVDYEEYDTMYLFIKVTDLNQVVNEASSNATLTIIINDINDCAPEFIHNTLQEIRIVMEEAMPNTLAGGSIQAVDRDGHEFNNITYTLLPIRGTNESWIQIEKYKGVLSVSENAKIDCDIPRIDALYYEIQLTDGLYTTLGELIINVTDINNKVPQFHDFNKTVEIYENATTGTYIGTIAGYDNDRDEPHNVLEYTINYNIHKELQKFFVVGKLNGSIYVDLQNGYELDRDNNVTEHMVNVDVKDNYLDSKSETRNSEPNGILVVLLDVNDNAPEMVSPKDFLPKWDENAIKGDVLLEYTLTATDKDQPNHPNSWVSFEILDINPGKECNPNVEDYKNLFTMIGNFTERTGQFVANKDLQGYYGIWKIFIRAYDHGEPQQSSNGTYELEVFPVNFHSPKILFPTEQAIRLRHDQPSLDGPLKNTDKTSLRSFEAFDPDGGNYGNVTFEIFTETEIFAVKYINRSHSDLILKKKVEVDLYMINIKAKDGGGLTSDSQHLRIFVIDMNGSPYFDPAYNEETPFNTNFTEGEKGLLKEYRIIPEAIDPKNNGIEKEEDKIKIYYYLDKNYEPKVVEFFHLDQAKRNLTLVKPLDKTMGKELRIRIIASNIKEEYEATSTKNSQLIIKVKVKDANPKPVFDELTKKYGCSITIHDENKIILHVHANDSDIENSITTYHISSEIKAYGKNIEKIKDKIFKLDPDSGKLSCLYKIDSTMTGFFEFNITAEDNYQNKDQANVKVYILGESNRVSLIFLNKFSLIEENKSILQNVLNEQYGYDKCNIDDVSNLADSSDFVKVVVHFIRDNKPIDNSEILQKTNQELIAKLKVNFKSRGLHLDRIENSKNTQIEKVETTSSTTLTIIAIILGVLCGLLVIAFVLKTKSLKRQIKAFAPPEFGSRASDLNRIGVPTTNVFSVEGSNPVINDSNIKEHFDDASSVDSDGSDFIGINNDVNFMMKNGSASSKNSSVISKYENNKENIIKRISLDNNEEKVMRF